MFYQLHHLKEVSSGSFWRTPIWKIEPFKSILGSSLPLCFVTSYIVYPMSFCFVFLIYCFFFFFGGELFCIACWEMRHGREIFSSKVLSENIFILLSHLIDTELGVEFQLKAIFPGTLKAFLHLSFQCCYCKAQAILVIDHLYENMFLFRRL